MYELMHGDCLELMKNIKDKSIDLILCDLPYETTAFKWDKLIDFNLLWQEYERIIKDNGIIALFSTQPFTTKLINSNIKLWRYNWIWKKETSSGFLNANYAPLKITEDICIFSKGTVGSASKNKIRYYPQGTKEVNILKNNNPNSKWRKNAGYGIKNNKLNSNEPFIQKKSGYNNNILEFKRDKPQIHPTQKPVALLRYLINCYTKNQETVLDNCMGSGSTGVASRLLNRNFIGIEKDDEYFEIAKKRIENELKDKQEELF